MNANYKKIKGFASACKDKKLNAKALLAKWAKEKRSEDSIGFEMLKIFYAAINGKWKADFSKDDYKYYPIWWYKPGVGFVLSCVTCDYDCTYVSPRLCTETREQQEHAVKYSLKMWRKYLSGK